ncbi:hypothetical protein [Nonomuraea sp. NPDC050783]|uniref:hypothetical protein n=1 Tax=Nonomuraea sp. NPDC050783 TaxID=3154634 RepID=UPI00346649BF
MNCVRCGRPDPSHSSSCPHNGQDSQDGQASTPETVPLTASGGGAAALPVTRYLCVAAQLDDRVSDPVIREILDDRFRAVAQSPGVDLATVLKYALTGRQRRRVRDAVLAWLELGLLAILLLVWTLDPGSAAGAIVLVVPLMVLLAWLVVFMELQSTYETIIFPYLTRESFDPADAPLPRSPELRERLAEIGARAAGNVTVFARYSPFAGYGAVINTWSFCLNVSRPEEGEEVVPFAVGELYDRIAEEVARLGLPGVTVEDRLFVNGLDLQHDAEPRLRQALLPDPMAAPVPAVSEDLIRDLRADPRSRARPYLVVSVTGWEGEVVVSIFLRLVLLPSEGLLFAEASSSLLPPLRAEYREVDELVHCSTSRWLARLARRAGSRTYPALLRALPNTVRELRAPQRRRRLHREAVKAVQGHAFNYGAAWNPRELATDHLFYRYFQQLDKEMYVKSAEQRIMDALTDFLAEHHVDVSDLRQRQLSILNHGIFVTGQAQVTSQSMAAGAGAVARTGEPAKQGFGGLGGLGGRTGQKGTG